MNTSHLFPEDQLKTNFLETASHELRTPITIISQKRFHFVCPTPLVMSDE